MLSIGTTFQHYCISLYNNGPKVQTGLNVWFHIMCFNICKNKDFYIINEAMETDSNPFKCRGQPRAERLQKQLSCQNKVLGS